MTALVRDVTESAASAENDQKLMARLIDIRSVKADDPDGVSTDKSYASAFHDGGIDVVTLPAAETGTRIRAKPEAVRLALAAALDDWAAVRRRRRGNRAGRSNSAKSLRWPTPTPGATNSARCSRSPGARTACLASKNCAARHGSRRWPR